VAESKKMNRLLDHVRGKAEGTEGDAVETMDDREWVYLNLFQASLLKRADAPSSGAWGMLKWAAKSPDQFYRMWATAQKEVGRKEMVLAERKGYYTHIERAIKEFEVGSKTKKKVVKRKKSKPTDGNAEWRNLMGGKKHAE
jgi:hypothetical protein